jgi:hypothetical protein
MIPLGKQLLSISALVLAAGTTALFGASSYVVTNLVSSVTGAGTQSGRAPAECVGSGQIAERAVVGEFRGARHIDYL